MRVEKEEQAKRTIEELAQRLKDEEEKYNKLQDDVKKVQQQQVSTLNTKTIKPATKDTCC